MLKRGLTDSRTRGGDNLPKRISDALEWCNALLLIWSDAATKSSWVELEWTNAIALHKNIIPCKKDESQLPGILANKLYIDFHDVKAGIESLLNVFDIEPVEAELIDKSQIQTQPKPKRKPKKKVTAAVTAGTIQTPQIQLRSQALEKLLVRNVKKMLKQRDFFDSDRNESGKSLERPPCLLVFREKLVIDHSTGLTWQQSGSPELAMLEGATGFIWQQSGSPELTMPKETQKYIQELRDKKYAGYSDWRLPTLEEAMSLMEPKKNEHGLYIDRIFDETQSRIWTADKYSASEAWYVDFDVGRCVSLLVDINPSYVRAVR